MKILVTGVAGQLGHDVVNELIKRGHQPIGVDVAEMDITDKGQVDSTISKIKPEAVVHCAAWTAVDLAEEKENEEKVYAINALGTKYIAEACKNCGAKMIYISTDYVFNGQGETPWTPDCKDYEPLNYYGKSKLSGEKFVSSILDNYFIVRIAWVFGKNGNNFVKTMLKLAKSYSTLKVVCDQIGTPTYTYDLAKLLCDMVVTDKYGYYHATNEGGYISWCDFAKEIFKIKNLPIEVTPVTTKEYGVSKAQRPFNSRLDKQKLSEMGFNRLPSWKDALTRYLSEIDEEI